MDVTESILDETSMSTDEWEFKPNYYKHEIGSYGTSVG